MFYLSMFNVFSQNNEKYWEIILKVKQTFIVNLQKPKVSIKFNPNLNLIVTKIQFENFNYSLMQIRFILELIKLTKWNSLIKAHLFCLSISICREKERTSGKSIKYLWLHPSEKSILEYILRDISRRFLIDNCR